ncbi:MAG: Gfo/Idh/MocA family oxidoreductase, partial [Pedosphaera parvula]|nr:Gfo/Idh/MocA family oxidoreductase [Pedosphaera parvula]
KTETKPLTGGATRRDFLKKTATAAAVVATANVLKPTVYGQAPSAGRVIGANDRIVVGHIGVGGQGMAHVRDIKAHAAENNVVQVAVCDVWAKRTESAKATIGGDCQGFDDHRKLLDRKDIDAVVVATVDHWHTPCSVDAMQAGKHVYVEKPMTRYLGEAFQIYDTVKRTGKILQVGSQGCSDLKWHKAAELIKAGSIGPMVMVQGSYMRNDPQGEWNYTIDPDLKAENTDWDRWLGPVKKRVSFNPDHYFRWRKYYPYCAGLLGDLFPHKLHPYMLATGAPEFPIRVACVGNKKVGTDLKSAGPKKTAYVRDVPEIVQLIAEFPSGMVMHITSSTVNEIGTQELIRGHKGNLYMGSNRVAFKPEKAFADEVEPFTSDAFGSENLATHEKNWFDAIRGKAQANCGIDLAVRVQAVISLAEMSERLNLMCLFDEKTRKITDGSGKEIKPLSYGWTELS